MKPIQVFRYLASVAMIVAGIVTVSGCSSHSSLLGGSGGASSGEYDGQTSATMLATISVNPDATKLVFAGAVAAPNGGDTKNLFVLDLKTLVVTRLTTTDECQSDPAYSFDGTKIAYISRAHENEASHVFICNADGTHARQVTTVPNVEDGHPAFSWDGTRLAFARCNRFIPDSRGFDTWTDNDTYTIKTDGRDEQRLTTGNYDGEIRPAFYPDGKSVLFEHTVLGPGYQPIMQIYTANLPSSEADILPPVRQSVISSNNDACPFFYPDGEHVAYCSSLDAVYRPALRCYDLKTGTNVLLHSTSDGEPDGSPVVTQDGKQIYFLRGYGANIWVLDTVTNTAHQVADGSIFDNPLGWKPSR